MRKVFWLMTLGMSVLGGMYLVYVVTTATKPEYETAGVALALATAAIPYIFTRCLEGIRHADVMRVRIVPDRPGMPRDRNAAPLETPSEDVAAAHQEPPHDAS